MRGKLTDVSALTALLECVRLIEERGLPNEAQLNSEAKRAISHLCLCLKIEPDPDKDAAEAVRRAFREHDQNRH